MAIETRKERMDHMFALMEEVRVLVGRLEEHPEIPAAVRTLNYRVDELKKELSLNKYELEKEKEDLESMFNMKRGNPFNEGSGGDD
jgi:hypothetical protein